MNLASPRIHVAALACSSSQDLFKFVSVCLLMADKRRRLQNAACSVEGTLPAPERLRAAALKVYTAFALKQGLVSKRIEIWRSESREWSFGFKNHWYPLPLQQQVSPVSLWQHVADTAPRVKA